MSSAFTAASSVPLSEAIDFLIRPLSMTMKDPAPTLNSLKQILLSTLTSIPTWLRNSRLTLTFSSAAPPRAVYAACIATQIEWSSWFHALGGREFDLTIESTLVTAQFTNIPGRYVIWKQSSAPQHTSLPTAPVTEAEPKVQVPISKFSQSVQLNKRPNPLNMHLTLASAQSKTLAQQLLQSQHEDKEAEEIFAMISNLNACVITPTPTRERFNVPRAPMVKPYQARLSALEEEIFHSQSSFRQNIFAEDHNTTSPVSSPESSRPSSPASSSSFCSSSQESLTSMSATSSQTTSPITRVKPFAFRVDRNSCDISIPVVDTTKSQVQRYLYQGGQSTVLTGGVMLGAAASKAPSAPSFTRSPLHAVPQGRASVGSRKVQGFSQPKSQQSQSKPGSCSGRWRRGITLRA